MTTSRRNLTATATLLSLTLALSSCGTAPYVDSRREAGQRVPVGMSTADVVAICYSSHSTTPEELFKLAESECAKTGRVPVRADESDWSCTLFAPTRIFYRCTAKP